MPFTACFRRFIRRPLSNRERDCIELLERQRARAGRVRAYINDPDRALTRALLQYLHWHQARLTQREAIIISPPSNTLSTLHLKPSTLHLKPSNFASIRGYCRPVSQIIIFDADLNTRLDQTITAVAPLLSGRDSILLIVGNADNQNSRFAQLFNHWALQNHFFQTINPDSHPPLHPPPPSLHSPLSTKIPPLSTLHQNPSTLHPPLSTKNGCRPSPEAGTRSLPSLSGTVTAPKANRRKASRPPL